MDCPVVAVVLAGGTGTRLYPASRSDRPKQLLSLDGDRPLLTRTVDRARFADEVYVLTRERYAEAVREAAPGAAVLVEPAGRDTGPALTYAAHRIREQVGECVLCCLPSDHHVEGDFAGTMRTAAQTALETRGLVTVGVEPTRPATGYGYVEPGLDEDGYFAVERFVEKPDRATARTYVDQHFLWNAGVFAWTPTAFLDAARETVLGPLVEALAAGDPAGGFAAVESISVDHAVLEAADDVFVVPAGFAWDDLGAWDALQRVCDRDADGNAVLGEALALDAADCVLATDGHVSAVGVSDLVVASYDGHTLVAPLDEAERVREVVARLRERGQF